MTQSEVLQVFRDTGALLEGHFVLRSGLHSRQFFQCALALQQMPIVEKLGAALAAKVKSLGAVTVVAWVFGLGALLFAPLGASALFTEAPSWSTSASVLGAFVVAVPTVRAYSVNAWARARAAPTLVTI